MALGFPRFRSDAYANAASAGKAPSAAAGAGAGTSPTIAVSGTDTYGQVSVTEGSSPPAGGTLVTLTFAKPYNVAPTAVVVTQNDSNAALSVYASATTTALTIACHGTAIAADVYKISYVVVGGA
jgi:hypothetical protein